jgi:hypothetical protein
MPRIWIIDPDNLVREVKYRRRKARRWKGNRRRDGFASRQEARRALREAGVRDDEVLERARD